MAAIILTARYVPESRAAVKRRLDPAGQFLVILTLVALTYAIIEGPTRGWSSALILLCFGVAVAALAVLLAWEARCAEPLIDLRFFRSLPFSGAALTAITAMAAFAGFLFLITLYLQEVRGYRPLTAGLFLLPMAVAMACSAPLCGRVLARRGPRIPLLIAGTGITAGGVLLAFLTAASPAWYVLVSCLVLGFGMGWVNAPITNSAVAGMPRGPGRHRGRNRLHQPAGRLFPRRRGRRLRPHRRAARRPDRYRVHVRHPARLVGRGRPGHRRVHARAGYHGTRGPGERGQDGHADRARGRPRARSGRMTEGPAGRRRRLLVLLICSSSLFLTYLDTTILNVALPTIAVDLHASLAGLQWIADSYLLVVASLLMLTGSTADRLGRKRLFLTGLAGFSLGSLLCSLARIPAL